MTRPVSPAALSHGLFCPSCGQGEFLRVLDTRPADGGIKRRRLCEYCGRKFTTFEKVWEAPNV